MTPINLELLTEMTRQFFAINSELRASSTSAEDIDCLLDELYAIAIHTPSLRLRDRCRAILAEYSKPLDESDIIAGRC